MWLYHGFKWCKVIISKIQADMLTQFMLVTPLTLPGPDMHTRWSLDQPAENQSCMTWNNISNWKLICQSFTCRAYLWSDWSLQVIIYAQNETFLPPILECFFTDLKWHCYCFPFSLVSHLHDDLYHLGQAMRKPGL